MGLRRVYEMTRRDHALHHRGLWQLMLRRWVQPCLRLRVAARTGGVPLVIAGVGLASALGAESFAEVVARTVVAISPGSDELLRKVIVRDDAGDETSKQGEVVVVLGLGTAFLAA